MTTEIAKKAQELETRPKLSNGLPANALDDHPTVAQLRTELAAMREQLARATSGGNNLTPNIRNDPSFNMTTGRALENGLSPAIAGNAAMANPSKRKPKRNSAGALDEGVNGDALYQADHDPRAVSMAFAQDNLGSFRAPGSTAYIPDQALDDPAEEIMKLLENEEALDEDVLLGLIKHLKLPSPSSTNPPFAKEVLFPAHLISLVTNEMWKYGFMHESERFLANVMQTIQQHVMVCALCLCWRL